MVKLSGGDVDDTFYQRRLVSRRQVIAGAPWYFCDWSKMPHILARNPSDYSSNLIDSRPSNHIAFTRESQYLHSTDVRECSPVDGEASLCYTSVVSVGTSQDRWGPRPQQVSLAMCHYVPILAGIAPLETLFPLWLNLFFFW